MLNARFVIGMEEGSCPTHMVMERQGVPPSGRAGFFSTGRRKAKFGKSLEWF